MGLLDILKAVSKLKNKNEGFDEFEEEDEDEWDEDAYYEETYGAIRFDDDLYDTPDCCEACGGPYPLCADGCGMFDK